MTTCGVAARADSRARRRRGSVTACGDHVRRWCARGFTRVVGLRSSAVVSRFVFDTTLDRAPTAAPTASPAPTRTWGPTSVCGDVLGAGGAAGFGADGHCEGALACGATVTGDTASSALDGA